MTSAVEVTRRDCLVQGDEGPAQVVPVADTAHDMDVFLTIHQTQFLIW